MRANSCLSPAAWSIVIGLCALAAHADLIHRYSFKEPGVAKDSVGNVDGNLKGDAAIADGKLVLKNDNTSHSDDEHLSYLEFASPILPRHGSVCLVTWFCANDVGAFARIFNFGDNENGEGRAFIYFVPRNADGMARAAISATDVGAKTFQDNDRLDDGKTHMLALVIDGDAKKLHVYIDGKEPKPPQDLGANTLDKIRPVDNWLGRFSFELDPGISASITEFRVYDNALSADDVAAAFNAGPGALPSGPATQPSKKP
jgi:hypothetical protein